LYKNKNWAIIEAQPLLPNAKNVLGHCHREIQNFHESKLFSTGRHMYSKNVYINMFVGAACDKMKVSQS
jgi:hypothetical protein